VRPVPGSLMGLLGPDLGLSWVAERAAPELRIVRRRGPAGRRRGVLRIGVNGLLRVGRRSVPNGARHWCRSVPGGSRHWCRSVPGGSRHWRRGIQRRGLKGHAIPNAHLV
jgi:hypothetical protein